MTEEFSEHKELIDAAIVEANAGGEHGVLVTRTHTDTGILFDVAISEKVPYGRVYATKL